MATGVTSKNKPNNNDIDTSFTIQYNGKKDINEILGDAKSPEYNSRLKIERNNQESAWTNQLFFGDNLEVLYDLLYQKNMAGKVKLIYIDPPYGTNSSFQSRNLDDAYDDILVGAQYLEFMRERLILLRELLSPDGSIYVHLDENMAFPIKLIMDEVFGGKNFRNWITRKKCNRKNYTRKKYGNISDYILFYSKSDKYTWNRAYEPWTEEAMKREYQYIEEETGRRYKKVPVHAPGVRNGATGGKWKGKYPPKGKHWQYTPEKLDELDAKGEIYWSPTGNPRRKVYFENSNGLPVQDIWMDFKDAHNQNIKVTGYPTEKNIDLLDRIVLASSNPGDIVLDCFAGSGTTLVSAENNARKWVGVDSSFHSIETVAKRFAKGSKPMGNFAEKEIQEEQLSFIEDDSDKSVLKTSLEFFSKENELSDEKIREFKDLFYVK
ncbi:Modification methylase MboII [Paraliobacillus sp. PM-2]|uniref:site-specific DNA-methyltransferase n=1 Tax=Paraliobacillus sp. PM-2 TaxID=1462524 RepID=UPI00061BEAD9|nr:site-specific DNA-methyltransferase [Paraliobacillus sp. PM-2]CQR45870.1 Modification methylase MboII [Paraliobacillus sp. PM-2]